MKRKVGVFVLAGLVTIFSFLYFCKQITDGVPFQSDEAYWISTGKIIPVLLQGRWNDPFWHEYYGFTNFNGAKFVFGLGLAFFGHTESEINLVGVPPDTYYQWRSQDGKVIPKDHILFPMIRDARIVSAIFVSLSIGAIVILVYALCNSLCAAVVAGLLLFFHPMTQYVSTHAFADSILLFFIIIFLFVSSILLRVDRKKQIPLRFQIILGVLTAILMSIKINGVIFLISFFIVFLVRFYVQMKTVSLRSVISPFVIISISAMVSFFVLHPNIFFYRDYTFMQMIQDRIAITQHHIAYFSIENPDVVNLQLHERIRSLAKHLFPLWLIPLYFIGLMTSFVNRRNTLSVYYLICLMGLIILSYVLSYVVFDEIRYFLPLLPFIILTTVHPLFDRLN